MGAEIFCECKKIAQNLPVIGFFRVVAASDRRLSLSDEPYQRLPTKVAGLRLVRVSDLIKW